MKILFASPDRDLVSSYKLILDEHGHDTLAAYDGTQAISACENAADIAVIDERLPRTDMATLYKILSSHETPTLTLTYSQSGGQNTLPYPFFPDEFMAACEKLYSENQTKRGEST